MSMLSTTKYRNSCLILAMFFALVLQHSANGQTVLHVDGDDGLAVPNPPDPGDTWTNAFKYLPDALALAKANATPANPYQLWVAETDVTNPYRPDRDAANPDGTGNQTATFLLDFNDVHVLGGFVGNETQASERDAAVHITVLSGAITNPWDECEPGTGNCFTETLGIPGCDNMCGVDPCPGCCELICAMDPLCCVVEWEQFCADQAIDFCLGAAAPYGAYHVVRAQNVDVTVRIDGFTITRGSAVGGTIDQVGAGMTIVNSSLAVIRVIFTANAAPIHAGGGMHIRGLSDPLVVNCEFIENSGREAGALHTEDGMAGGTFVNCLFSKNTSEIEGGAINPGADGTLTFINCTFADNSVVSAAGGGAIFTEMSGDGDVILTNCILWGNEADGSPSQIDDSQNEVSVTFSCVEGDLGEDWDDGDNINDDPLFFDPATGNYRILIGSMVIDKGDPIIEGVIPDDMFDINNDGDFFEPTPDLDLFHRVLDGDQIGGDRVDMGAYEFVHPDSCPWDLDGGGFVGAGDLLLLLADWGNPYGAADLLALLADWGPCPCCSFVPPSLADELADACLSNDDWQDFLDALANGTPAKQENYICWLTHYFEDCNRCICIGASGCPGADPFDD